MSALMLEKKHVFAMLAVEQHPRMTNTGYMFSDITAKILSHVKTLVPSKPRYSVRARLATRI